MIKEASKLQALKDGARRYKDAVTGKNVKTVKETNARNVNADAANIRTHEKQVRDFRGTQHQYATELGETIAHHRATINNLVGARALSKAKSDRNRARLLTAGGITALGLGARAAMKGAKKPVSKSVMKSLKKHKGKAIAGGAGVTGLSLLAGNK